MRSTFKVLFYLKKNAPKKNGSVPVMCRITIDGTIAQFSCKCDIHPDLWDIKSNRASGKSTVALETNRFLDKIRVGINAKYKEIAERDNYVTAEKVKNAFLGLEMRHETLLKVFAQHNEDFFKQVNAGLRCPSTYNKYSTVYKHLEEFIKTRYRVSDIALKELTPVFITDFDIWKIQCKLPPKTKRFCPLKTFNNAPLKSLDRWGYYYFRFSSVRLNRLRNKLLANYLKSGGNELATVRISAFCVAMLSNNSFICKYSIFFRKYELSAAVL